MFNILKPRKRIINEASTKKTIFCVFLIFLLGTVEAVGRDEKVDKTDIIDKSEKIEKRGASEGAEEDEQVDESWEKNLSKATFTSQTGLTGLPRA